MGTVRALYTIWQREMLKWLRNRVELVTSLLTPIIWLAVFGMGLMRSVNIAPGIDYLTFLAPGIICQTILFSAFFSGVSVLYDRQFGFMQEILVAPVSRLVIVVGTVLGGAAIAFLQGIIALFLAIVFGAHFTSLAGVAAALGIMLLVSLAFMAMGVALASGLKEMASFQRLGRVSTMPMWFLSGAVFAINTAPSWLVAIAVWNPLTYGVDALRASLTGVQMFDSTLSLSILSFFTVAMLVLGTYLFKKSEV